MGQMIDIHIEQEIAYPLTANFQTENEVYSQSQHTQYFLCTCYLHHFLHKCVVRFHEFQYNFDNAIVKKALAAKTG